MEIYGIAAVVSDPSEGFWDKEIPSVGWHWVL